MVGAAPQLVWEQITAHVMRTRLPFCDVTVGVVHGGGTALVVDTGTTLAEARAVASDVHLLTGSAIEHVVLTHNHFDHVLGCSAFAAGRTYCAPEVVSTMAHGASALRADAVGHGADAAEVDSALAAMTPPCDAVADAVVTLGGAVVRIAHLGRGHTDHDLVAVVESAEPTVVFCGDLVEESGDPCIDGQSDLDAWPVTLERLSAAGGEAAAYVPGHGAVVDARFVHRQAQWLAARR